MVDITTHPTLETALERAKELVSKCSYVYRLDPIDEVYLIEFLLEGGFITKEQYDEWVLDTDQG